MHASLWAGPHPALYTPPSTLTHAEEPDIKRQALGDAQDPQARALPQGTLSGRDLDPEAGEAVLALRPPQACRACPTAMTDQTPRPDLQTRLWNRPRLLRRWSSYRLLTCCPASQTGRQRPGEGPARHASQPAPTSLDTLGSDRETCVN